MSTNRYRRFLTTSHLKVLSVPALASVLSGCIAAAAPLMLGVSLASTAFAGFGIYKVVQTTNGGSVEIAFAAGKDEKPLPPQPLSPANRIAVWPGDQLNVLFAERLQRAGKIVTSPSTVSASMAAERLPTDIKLMTEAEQTTGFSAACRLHRADTVFAAKVVGESTDTNMFSFKRAATTYRLALIGFSCAQRSIEWRDEMVVVVSMGGHIASDSEVNQAAAEAWAERVLEAMNGRRA